MVHEIQKTFLLPDATLLEKLQKDGIVFEIYEIETFYTKITYFYDVKFQNLNGNFYKITRLNNPILEQNQEEKISKKDYEKARKKLIEKSIKKKRYEFKLCSFKSFIDVYEDLNLYVLKVFFPTLEMANLFTPPKEFRIQRELCGVLDSKNIILYGFNNLEIDIEKCFKIIEKNQNFTLDFPSSILAFDGYRIFLFYLFRKLKLYWNLALENRQRETFCEFFSYARKIYIILMSTEEIFDEELNKNLALRFKDLVKKSHCILANNELGENLLLFLSGEDLQNLLSDFDFFIKEDSFYKSEQEKYFFKQMIAMQLRKRLVLFKKNLLKNFEIETFEENFLGLSVFLEYFHNLYNLKILSKLYNKYFICDLEKKTLLKLTKKKEKLGKLIHKASKKLKIYKGY
ncbi:hypothetical protein ACFBCD_001833 [Campylobacter coli]